MASVRIDVERILCPVDLSEASARALGLAVRLAASFDARVDVLHVLEPPPANGQAWEPDRAVRRRASQALARLSVPLRDSGVPIEMRLLEGEPWRVIVGEAGGLPADLLVIGTHGRGGFEHLLLGSVAEKVLRRAPCPVLTVGRAASAGPGFRRILCALDLTGASQDTVGTALFLAHEHAERLTLLHVLEAGEAATARAGLAAAAPQGVRPLCPLEERVEVGKPWHVIVRVARELDADLIVMGFHSQGSTSRLLFGSTVNQVVRRAGCPVLVVRERISLASGRDSTAAAKSERT